MNILHIVLALDTGGLERVVLDLMEKSSDQFTQYLCCLNKVGACKVELESMAIPYWELANYGSRKIRTLLALRKIIIENNIDVIHTHNPSPHFYGCLVGLFCRVPIIHTKHGRNYPKNKFLVLKNYVFSYFTDKIVCVSDDAMSVALDIEKVPARKVQTILNGIDIDKYSNIRSKDSLSLIDVNREIISIGIVARLSAEKDHATLLHALSLVVKEYSNVKLIIVGDGPLRSELEKLAIDLDVMAYCSFLGNRDDIPQLLSQIDLFVLSSITEGVSLTLLEAMAASLPIVCTDVGGNSEVVEDGVNGIIVPSREPALLAKALLELIRHPERRLQMGKAGFKRVKSVFSIQRTVAEYEKLYFKVTKTR